MEATTEIKTIWNWFARIRQTFQHVEKIGETLVKLDGMEERITQLEKRLEQCPGEACPRCGKLTFRALRSGQMAMGMIPRFMKCAECNLEEEWLIDSNPAKRRTRA